MLDLTKYRELDAKVATALGYEKNSSGVWRTPDNLGYVMQPPAYTNLDARCFDLMHEHKLWTWQDPESGNFMTEYMLPGDVRAYHLEYAKDHHTSKIAMRCSILNALIKLLKKEDM